MTDLESLRADIAKKLEQIARGEVQDGATAFAELRARRAARAQETERNPSAMARAALDDAPEGRVTRTADADGLFRRLDEDS